MTIPHVWHNIDSEVALWVPLGPQVACFDSGWHEMRALLALDEHKEGPQERALDPKKSRGATVPRPYLRYEVARGATHHKRLAEIIWESIVFNFAQ